MEATGITHFLKKILTHNSSYSKKNLKLGRGNYLVGVKNLIVCCY
jgi:hypothetical protein